VSQPRDEASAGPGPRPESGGAAGQHRDRPHVSENAEGAPLQESAPSPDDVPVLPANAHGKDRVAAEEQVPEVDEASMYDRRPGEDKDRRETDMP
jgi:hypothetical protein